MKKLLITLLLFALATSAQAVTTSEYFDYDAIIRSPEDYKYISYAVVGRANLVYETDVDIADWVRPMRAVVEVDNDSTQPILIIFDAPNKPIEEASPVYMIGICLGTTEIQSALGFNVVIPVFVASYIEQIEE